MRLTHTGVVGFTEGYEWTVSSPAASDIDIDNDGVYSPPFRFLIDLSEIASRILGQQVSQWNRYTVRKVRIGVRHVDDIVDNDESSCFAGELQWFTPTQHRREAMALVREIEKETEGDEIDVDSFYIRTDDRYTGLRVQWHSSLSGSGEVSYPTAESVSGHPGTVWALEEIFGLYNQMLPSTKDRSLWTGRAGAMNTVESLMWAAGASSGVGDGDSPPSFDDFDSGDIMAKPFAGLMRGMVTHSSLDEIGAVDDDYHVYVNIEFDVGVDA